MRSNPLLTPPAWPLESDGPSPAQGAEYEERAPLVLAGKQPSTISTPKRGVKTLIALTLTGAGGELQSALQRPPALPKAGRGLSHGLQMAQRPDHETLQTVSLPQVELDSLLPVTPSPEQLKKTSGSAYDLYQRIGVAAIVSLLTVKFVLVATTAVLYPLLGPLVQALNRNRKLRSQGRHVALWRATVVDCEIVARPLRSRVQGAAWDETDTLRLLVGDGSGARSLLTVPFEPWHHTIRAGEPAELLVMAQRRTFRKFQALKEIYLPESGKWIADYPYVNRSAFLDVSLSIEQERQSQSRQFEFSS
ncbi:hypothetical protein WJX73_007134 [Symbiochloris irregularis]|uniref:Uncharacterized protein n=1 Tax=Symbiochloris irregularis TaxID=706552 RepID=A0AAW1NZ01_9CHLO